MSFECGLCGTELQMMTGKHLNGPKCENPEQLSVSQYLERFPDHSTAISRRTAKPKSAVQKLEKLLKQVDKDLVAQAIAEIDAQIDDLQQKKDQLSAMLDGLSGNAEGG